MVATLFSMELSQLQLIALLVGTEVMMGFIYLPVDVPGRRELFTCNEDDSGAINYFCQTEICIEDDDGRFRVTCASDNNYSFQGPLLLHLWRQHIQLMRAWLL